MTSSIPEMKELPEIAKRALRRWATLSGEQKDAIVRKAVEEYRERVSD